MNHSRFILTTAKVVFFAVIGILVVTNPGKAKYEEYASKALKSHLKEEVCQEVTEILTNPCTILVDIAAPQLGVAIAQKTQRKNFLIFSIYQTNLSVATALPDYQFGTVAILHYFYTYQADRLD